MRNATDKRKFQRVRFEEPVVFDVENDWTALGTAADVSVGGIFVEAVDSATSIPFGANVTVHVRVSGELLALPGVVRWTRDGGIGVQFGLLGARETHVITEAIARHAPSGVRERAATRDEIDVDVDVDAELTG
jgi:type IV pilus assembly protein PilZ